MKKILIQFLFRLLDSKMRVTYDAIDRKATERWLYDCYADEGWKSYFRYEDLRLLKAIGMGYEGKELWVLVGRRFQLLNLYDDIRKAFELKKAEGEKKQATGHGETNKNETNTESRRA